MMEMTTVASTTIRLFLTSCQKYGRLIASRKCASVGCSETHVGVRLTISSSGLNAVEIIQKTGNTITMNTITPTMSHPVWRARLRLRRLMPRSRSAPCGARRRC